MNEEESNMLLPEPVGMYAPAGPGGDKYPVWHRGQMLGYARAAVLQERAACATVAANIGKPVGAGDRCTYIPETSSQAATAIRNRS